MSDNRPEACMERRRSAGHIIPPFASCDVPGCDPLKINGTRCNNAPVASDRPLNLQRPPQFPETLQISAASLEQLRSALLRTLNRLNSIVGGPPLPTSIITTTYAAEQIEKAVSSIETANKRDRDNAIKTFEDICDYLDATPHAISAETSVVDLLTNISSAVLAYSMPHNNADWTESTKSGRLHVPTLRHVLSVLDALNCSPSSIDGLRAGIASLLPVPPMTDEERAGFRMWAAVNCGPDNDENERAWHNLPERTRSDWVAIVKRYEAARISSTAIASSGSTRMASSPLPGSLSANLSPPIRSKAMAEVTQADREAAAEFFASVRQGGLGDGLSLAERFARHRTEAVKSLGKALAAVNGKGAA